MNKLLFSLVTVICLSTFGIIHAQSLSVKSIQITPSITSPSPNQEMTMKVQSYIDNVNSSTVIWSIDGKELSRGTGLTEIKLKAPPLGKKYKVTVTIINTNGSKSSESYILSSGSIDMIIETSGYKPPMYMGKIEPKFQNTIKIIAIPHIADTKGNEYDPKTLIYKWYKNDTLISDYSGYGKQFVEVQGSVVPRPYTVSVNVTTKDGLQSVDSIVFIEEKQSNLSVYQDDPLYGPLYNVSVKESIGLGKEQELKVRAIPYGFDKPSEGMGDLSFDWSVNGIQKDELGQNDTIILRAPQGATGDSMISLEVRNRKYILQDAKNAFYAIYGGVQNIINNKETVGGPAF